MELFTGIVWVLIGVLIVGWELHKSGPELLDVQVKNEDRDE